MDQLAIDGGKPVRSRLLPYGHQWIDDDDVAAVAEVLKGDWITQGPKVEEFENRVAEYCGATYGVAVSSGTAALHAACLVAGVSKGDEVVTSPLTFAATANAVTYCGGKPVFADIREDTLNIDVREVEKRLSSKTRVVLPVDFAGHPADLDDIRVLARERGVLTIEDACHALGAVYGGRRVGCVSQMTVLSFHPVKHITTGEGGMILTSDERLYERLKTVRHHGIVKDVGEEYGPWHYDIHEPGFNFRITDFQCALGISQLGKLDRFIRRRREIAAKYHEGFAGMDEIVTPVEAEGSVSAYHIYVIQLRTELLGTGRREVFEALRAENIGVNVHYMPLHLHPFYQKRFGYRKGDYPVAERYYERAITLPVFPAMTDEDVGDVIKAVQKVISHFSRKT